jgi:hypothetical protein
MAKTETLFPDHSLKENLKELSSPTYGHCVFTEMERPGDQV